MIQGTNIAATVTSGTVMYTGPDTFVAVPEYFFAGVEDQAVKRVFLAFDLSEIPEDAKLVACVLVLTGASDPGCDLVLATKSWADPLTAGTKAKWQASGNEPTNLKLGKSGDSGPDISYTFEIHTLYTRKELGQRFACSILLRDEVTNEPDDTRGVVLADLDTLDPFMRPRLSIVYEV